MIYDYLSTADQACLALCSHAMRDFLFPTPEDLRNFAPIGLPAGPIDHSDPEANAERIAFLTQLSRDLPQYYLCFGCLTLHTWHNLKLPFREEQNPDAKPAPCKSAPLHPLSMIYFPSMECKPTTPVSPFYTLDFAHIYLAMRTFYLGKEYGIPPEALSLTRTGFRGGDPPRGVCMSLEARICQKPPSLCFRMQAMNVVSYGSVLPSCYPRLGVCVHKATNKVDFYHAFCVYLTTKHKLLPPDYDTRSDVCQTCGTHYQLEIRPLQDTWQCLVLTVWNDFGSALFPHELKWSYLSEGKVQHASGALLATYSIDPRTKFEYAYVNPRLHPHVITEEQLTHFNVDSLRRLMFPSTG